MDINLVVLIHRAVQDRRHHILDMNNQISGRSLKPCHSAHRKAQHPLKWGISLIVTFGRQTSKTNMRLQWIRRAMQRLALRERHRVLSTHILPLSLRAYSSTSSSDGLRVGVVGLGAIGSIFLTQLGRVALTTQSTIRSVDAFVKPHHLQRLSQQRQVALRHANNEMAKPFASLKFHEEKGILVAEDDAPVRIATLEEETTTAPDANAERIDVVLVALKAYDSARAIEELQTKYAHRFHDDAVVVLLQNGLGVLPANDHSPSSSAQRPTAFQFVNGVTYVGGRSISLGNVAVSGMDTQSTYLAPMDSNSSAKSDEVKRKLKLLGEALSQAGLTWELLSPHEMQSMLWRKLIVNAAVNTIASLLNTPNGNVGACEWSRRCVDGVVGEAVAVAIKEGVDLQRTEQEMIDDVLRVAASTSANVCSTLADLRKGNRTEVDAITGQLVKCGIRHGVPTPMNALLLDLVKALETQQLRMERTPPGSHEA